MLLTADSKAFFPPLLISLLPLSSLFFFTLAVSSASSSLCPFPLPPYLPFLSGSCLFSYLRVQYRLPDSGVYCAAHRNKPLFWTTVSAARGADKEERGLL